MFMKLEVGCDGNMAETKWCFAEAEVAGNLEITEYNHYGSDYVEGARLCWMNAEDWEQFKSAGDAAFRLMKEMSVDE